MVQAPRRIGQYQIIKQLGRGGFGTTYLAQDSSSFNSLCVIKQLNPEQADLETAQKLFYREANILKSLKEADRIPKFIAYFEDNNNYYLVEEYIKGTTLDHLCDRPWQAREIIIFLWDILSILQVLHRNNIIHRDIKPSNLIQREIDSRIVLIDFGAVKQLQNVQASNQRTCISTIGYTPLEQTIGKPRLNSDIYALGMTAIQLLMGIEPQNLARDAEDNIIWTEKSSRDRHLTKILNQMVKTDPEKRYQSVEEVLKAIRHADDETIINLSTPTKITNSQSTNSSHRFKPGKIALAAVAITLGVIASIELIHPILRPLYYRNSGDRALKQYQPETALEKFQKAIDLQRNDAVAWKGRGDTLLMLGRYGGAMTAYDKAIAFEPNNVKTINNKGKALYQLGQYQPALATHEQVLKIDPENAEAWSGKGLAYIGLGKYQEAVSAFNQAQQIKPDQPTFWLEKAIALKYLQGEKAATEFYQEALDIYQDQINNNKLNHPLLWTNRGFIFEQLNRPLDAFHSYEQALALDPNFYDALVGKANTLNKVNRYEEALAVFDQAIEIRPSDYQVWFNRGNLLGQILQKHQEALNSFEQVITLRPDFAPAWLGKGLALTSLKQYQEALQAFDRAKELDSKDAFVWANRGLVLEKLDQDSEALESYNRAIELGFTPAQEMQAKLQQKLGL